MFRIRTPHLAAGLIAAITLTACGTSSTPAADSPATTSAATATEATADTATDTDTSAETDTGDSGTVEDNAGATLDGQAAEATADWDESSEVTITLADGASSAPGDGVTVDGDVVTITAAGTYRISGTLSDGQVVVDTADEGLVRLVLDGADIASSSSAAILVANADAAVVWLADGSQNHVAGGAASTEDTSDEPNAALFSSDDLTIAGTGSVTVDGTAVDGITSKDDLLIVAGTIEVTAVDDGLRGKDQLVVTGGTVTVAAGGDGMTSDNTGETDESGASNAAEVGHVVIAGGQVAISAGTDGIDAANTVTVSGGTLAIAAGDDGIHADQAISISAGSIDITQSNEGVESLAITISGGELAVVSSDDGINVADGTGGGRGGSSAASNGMFLEISGGTIVVDAGGDGIDVGGSITITGGTITVYGPTEQMNGALDVDGSFTVTGATLTAGGSAGMAESPEDGQPSLAMTFGSALAAGSSVAITAEDGTVVATYRSDKQIESLVVTTPDLVSGATYTVTVDGEALGTVTA